MHDEQQRLYEAWRERILLRHALVATSTQDQRTAQQAWDALGDDRPPPLPWQVDPDDERWSEQRLEMDLLAGARWPFFRHKTRERAPLNGHSHEQEGIP